MKLRQVVYAEVGLAIDHITHTGSIEYEKIGGQEVHGVTLRLVKVF